MDITTKIQEVTENVQNTVTEQRAKIEEAIQGLSQNIQGEYKTQLEALNGYSERITTKVNKHREDFNRDELLTDVKEEVEYIVNEARSAVDKGFETVKGLLKK